MEVPLELALLFEEDFVEFDSTDDSDSDSEIEEILANCITFPRVSIHNYFEETVQFYSDEEFIRHFRINRELFLQLVDEYGKTDDYQNLLKYNINRVTKADKTIAVFLWFAGHEACSFRDLSDRFNISTSTVHLLIKRSIAFFSNLSSKVIRWPNIQDMDEEAAYRENRSRIPGIIGCVDGSHIQIDPPQHEPNDYINRKGYSSVLLQGICNKDKKFIDIFVGYPGSVHDSRVFRNSPVQDKLNRLPLGYRLLGDSAYPCLRQLLVPYRDNGHLTHAQNRFNSALSGERIDIEHTFGILKQRFRQLYYCKLRDFSTLCHFVRGCTVLHNLSRSEEVEIFRLEEVPAAEPNLVPFNDVDIVQNGNILRDAICLELFN